MQQTHTRSSNGHGCLFNLLLTALIVFIPIVGHIICTVFILDDDLTTAEKVIWLVLVWILLPIAIGPLLYLLVGQRRNRVLGA